MVSAATNFLISFDNKTKRLMHDMTNVWPKRLNESKTLFLLDVANYLVEEIKKKNVAITVDGKEKKYAEDLRIGILEEGDGENSVAIYMDGTSSEMTDKYATKTVLYFVPNDRSPDWVRVLMRYGPWPADILPIRVSSSNAKIISRMARSDELETLRGRILMDRRRIENQLREAGARGARIGRYGNSIGMTVVEDIGFSILRREFGFDGQKYQPHWRPAFKATKKYAASCMEKVAVYITTGDRNVFNLPLIADKISESVLKNGENFAKEIAPFVK